ncbi:uncharacterized protein LOC109849196 [Asparagus officinalis]|uniref:uncharacterized protein LOC109849196 n=1 Tax=Asparagus officinalis TaxID=4686 RepID=UPI00098E6570|nr:uncharacterized protein LOC109849196 [Asparagus officinalis]
MAISMSSLWDFTSPVSLGHTLISSRRTNQVLAKSSRQKIKFVDSQSRSSTRGAQRLTITSATDDDETTPKPTAADPLSTETSATATQPPPPATQPKVQNTVLKKPPLTAREKLRAARVLSRYTDSKPAKKSLGSKVLDAMREGDGGKRRSGLPQAPENLLDDSKRGMPKPGLTFDFPGGSDLFFIVLSVVLISTVMFTTTYVVWKLGAIHFNEY